MDVHFTYEGGQPEGDIRQGDLLLITGALQEILKEYHPHYASNPDYQYLIVVTQSCDLAVRHGKCVSRYISLAAVRPLETLMEQELERQSTSSVEKNLKTFPQLKRWRIEDFVTKLLNNNLPEYFYLEPEPALSIDRPYVAYLALSTAIRSTHYEVCKQARFARLKEIFGAKVGWLVGNMYSRVATPEWVTAKCENPEDFSHKVNDIVENSALWVPEVAFDRLQEEQKKRRKELDDPSYRLTKKEIDGIVRTYLAETRRKHEDVARFVVEEAARVMTGVAPAQLQELEHSLVNNQKLRELVV